MIFILVCMMLRLSYCLPYHLSKHKDIPFKYIFESYYIIIYAVMKDSSTELHKISFTSSTIFLPLQHQLQIPPWRSLKVSQALPFIGKHDSPYALQQEYMQNASWPQNVSHRTFSHNFHFIMLINYIGHLWCLQSLVGLHLDLRS